MAAEDEIGEMVDEEMYQEHRDALVAILDALQPLNREDRRKMMECAKQFFGLPKHE